MDATKRSKAEADAGHGISFAEAFRVWLRVALLSFGGPAGQIAVMHRIIVDDGWERDLDLHDLHGLEHDVTVTLPEHEGVDGYTLLWDSAKDDLSEVLLEQGPGSEVIISGASMQLFRAH